MCGRYAFASSKEKIGKHFGLQLNDELQKNYNIAPTQQAYVITNDAPQTLQQLQWGLVPYWSKSEQVGSNLINARNETLASKPSFRLPIRQKRCLVLADSFYEWKDYGRKKIPHRIVWKDNAQLMVFAGIWDEWKKQDGSILKTFSIVTTAPNQEVQWIHSRMPAILQTIETQKQWLQPIALAEALHLLQPLPNDSLRVYPVSDKLNNVQYNEADLFNEIQAPSALFDFTIL